MGALGVFFTPQNNKCFEDFFELVVLVFGPKGVNFENFARKYTSCLMITYVSFLSDNEIDSKHNFGPKQVFPRSKQFLPERSIFHRKECFPTNDISRLLKKQLPEKNLCLKRTYSAKISFLPTNHIYPKIVFARKRYLRENMDSPNIIFA